MRVLGRRSTPDDPEPADDTPAPARQRARLPFYIHWPSLLALIALILVTLFAMLTIRGTLPDVVATWWPAAVLVIGVLWFLASLIRRNSRALLGSAALIGLAVSLLLAAQGIATLAATMVGVTYIAIGTAIILRGLLMRNQPIS
jgi:hypothetical protein